MRDSSREPTWLIWAATLVAATAGAAAAAALSVCHAGSAWQAAGFVALVTLALAAPVAAIGRNFEILFLAGVSAGAGSIGAILAVALLWDFPPPAVAGAAAVLGILAIVGVYFVMGTTVIEVGVAFAIVFAFAWFAAWPIAQIVVHRRAALPEAPAMQCDVQPVKRKSPATKSGQAAPVARGL